MVLLDLVASLVTQEKAWLDNILMLLGGNMETVHKYETLVVYDAFSARTIDSMEVLLATNNTSLALVAAGCTSK